LEEASKYISLFDFNRTLESMAGKLPKSDVQLMFREMDINKKGSLSISELARLWFRSQEARDLTPTFFKILQKTLEVNRVADV
jgi:Ca2+-binding EF-hand superfamily protein